MSKILLAMTLVFSVNTMAKVQCPGGVQFVDSVVVEKDNGQNVRLDINGVGLKRVFGFRIFYAAFYLERPSQNGDAIIQSNQMKVGVIHALRRISKNQLVGAWNDEFERLCGSAQACERLRPHHDTLMGYARDIQRGESLFIISFPDRFEFEINGSETFPPVYSPEYARLMQNGLFGPDASDAELKAGILGEKKVCDGLSVSLN